VENAKVNDRHSAGFVIEQGQSGGQLHDCNGAGRWRFFASGTAVALPPCILWPDVGCLVWTVACFDFGGQAFASHFYDEFVIRVNTQGYERIRLDRTLPDAGARGVVPGQEQCSYVISACWQLLSLYFWRASWRFRAVVL